MITQKRNLTWCLMLAFSCAFGQTTVQVASKKVSQSFAYSEGTEVQVEGEKASIEVKTWGQNLVQVVLVIEARHPDKETAKEDLKALEYSLTSQGKVVRLRNFNAKSGKLSSSWEARYTILVPEECPVKMTNFFGKTSVENLTSQLDIQSEFSPVNLANLSGLIHVRSRFGDVSGDWLHGQVKIETQRSNVTLKNLSGTFDIKSKYGIIKIFSDKKQLNLNIEAEKSDVYFFNPEPSKYGYELVAHYGGITVPNDLKINFVERSDQLQHAVFSPPGQHPGVFVKITYGDIVIRNSKP